MHTKSILSSGFIFASLLFSQISAKAQCGGWANVGNAAFSANTVEYTAIALDTMGTPYMVYLDYNVGNKATVMKYSNGSWTAIGSPGISTGTATYTRIAVDSSSTPYIVYTDWSNSYKATVKKYYGTGWGNVGSAGFSAGSVAYTTIALNSSGTPYVLYQDGNNSSKATVMTYDGSNWVAVGSAGFSAGAVDYCSLAIDGSGTPYVAYEDENNSNKATVMKYDGSSWVTVGSAGFSADTAYFTSLAIDGSGTPYIAYQDKANSNKTTVMKYNGSSWATVGSAGFSAGQAEWVSLALDGSGNPFVAYKDIANNSKATVMKYNGSSWVTVGTAGFSAGEVYWTSLAINSGGIPYVGYSDWGNNSKATVMDLAGLSISLDSSNVKICQGSTSVNFDYNATNGSPSTYSIAFSAGAIIAGFSNVSNTSLPTSPITITVPSGLAPGTYTGTLTVYNSPCVSPGTQISITVVANTTPTITLNGPVSVPAGNPVTINATVSNAGTAYSIIWMNKGTIFNTTTVPSVTYTKGSGTDTITAIINVTSAGCYKPDTSAAWTVADSTTGLTSPGLSRGEVTVYPNPFNEQISVSGLHMGDRACVYDLLGRKRTEVWEVQNKQAEQHFSLGELPAGTYFLHVWDAMGNTKTNIAVEKLK